MHSYTQQHRRDSQRDAVDFKECKSISSRFALYRYEMTGIIVYDSHARRSDEINYETPSFVPKREISPEFKNKKVDKVYDYGNYYSDRLQYLNMKYYTSHKTIPYEYTLVIPESTLKFDSRFEGGNLRKAIRLNENEYNLKLEYDTETEGYTQ